MARTYFRNWSYKSRGTAVTLTDNQIEVLCDWHNDVAHWWAGKYIAGDVVQELPVAQAADADMTRKVITASLGTVDSDGAPQDIEASTTVFLSGDFKTLEVCSATCPRFALPVLLVRC